MLIVSAVAHIADWTVTMAFRVDLVLGPVTRTFQRCSWLSLLDLFTFRPRVKTDRESLYHLWLTIHHQPQFCQDDQVIIILELLSRFIAALTDSFRLLVLTCHTNLDGVCPSWHKYKPLLYNPLELLMDALSCSLVIIDVIEIVVQAITIWW